MSAADASHTQTVHTLYSDHHGWLFGWLRKKLGCPHNAADLAHDTFTRILSSRDALSGMREPRAYLTTTAQRLVIDGVRRKRIEQDYLRELAHTRDLLQGYQSPEDILITLAALEHIAFVLDGLASNMQQAFLLFFLDGMKQQAIALQLGVSERMVRKYLMQAVLHCQHALDV